MQCRGDVSNSLKPSALVDADENANAHLMASTSVFVVEPGETVSKYSASSLQWGVTLTVEGGDTFSSRLYCGG